MGLVSTFFMVLIPIMFGIYSGSLFLSDLSANVNVYLSIISIVSNIVVLVLFILTMSGFANYYNEVKIFQNSLYVVILNIVSIIISPIFTHFIGQYPSLISVVLGLVYVAVFGILSGFFFREAFYALAEKSDQQHFKHAGWLLFIGGILAVIVIGVFVILLGRMFAILGFYSIKQKSS